VRHPRASLSGLLLVLAACADEGASTGGTCPAFANRCTLNNQTAWWRNAASDQSALAGGSTCYLFPIGCHYVFTPQGTLDRDAILCRTASTTREPGVRIQLRFRAPFRDLPTGRVLRLGADFTVETLYERGSDPLTGTAGVRYDARLPVRGDLTLTVLGPPRHQLSGGSPSGPSSRIEGQGCGDRLNVAFRGETREVDFL